MTNQYRVENKSNIHASRRYNGKKTSFSLFERDGDAFFYAGDFTARGWDQSDDQCIAAAQATIDLIENE